MQRVLKGLIVCWGVLCFWYGFSFLTGIMVHTIWMGAVESHSNCDGNLWLRASPHVLAGCPWWHQDDCFWHSGNHHSASCFAGHWLQGKSHLCILGKTNSWSNNVCVKIENCTAATCSWDSSTWNSSVLVFLTSSTFLRRLWEQPTHPLQPMQSQIPVWAKWTKNKDGVDEDRAVFSEIEMVMGI